MARRKKELNSNNTKIAVLFFVFVFFIVFFSLIFKGISIISKSKFDNYHRFTIGLSSVGKYEIMSFSPRSSSVSIIKIDGDIEGINIKKALAIYLSGEASSEVIDLNNDTPESLMWKTISNSNKIKTNLTIFDIARLFIFSKMIPLNDITTKSISLNLTPTEIDKIIGPLVVDKDIVRENQTIEVINGTDIAGLGNWTSRLLTNSGGNVVLVSTASKEEETSSISYSGKKTYTVERLEKVLGFDAVKKETGAIADIVVVIGKDRVASLGF